AMPEQEVAGPGEHAHTLEARGLAYVARAAVCRMQPQHIGLGAQAQVIADSSMYRGLRTLPAVTSACGRHPLVVGNLIVRGGAFVYQRHGMLRLVIPWGSFFLAPVCAGAFFFLVLLLSGVTVMRAPPPPPWV